MRSNRNPIPKNLGTMCLTRPKVAKQKNATFEEMKPNVPEFFRIGFRFERIPGRSASFLQKWRFDFFAFLLRFFDSIGSIQHTAGIKICPDLHRIQGRIIRALDNNIQLDNQACEANSLLDRQSQRLCSDTNVIFYIINWLPINWRVNSA